jgi:adenine-specific DNA-methyltransferase
MAVGHNKSELSGDTATLAVRSSDLSPPLPTAEASVVFSYPGKLSRDRVLQKVDIPFSIVENSCINSLSDRITSNSIFWADNWYGLHKILSLGEKATLIYLDPPYATGLDFQSRNQEHAYNDSLSNAAYIEFIRRRIILMREILAENGSIYVHIGHQMVGEMKIILDEVFGAKNFRNIITRRKCSSKNFTKHQFLNLHDYILFYSKSNNYTWNQPTEKPDPEWISREYPKVDEKGQYKLVPIHAPGVRRGETGGLWRGVPPPSGKHWQYIPSKLDEFDAKGEIHWSKTGNPRRKVYLTDDKGLPLTDYWDKYRDAHHQSILITGYPTEKNFDMMKMLISASSNPGDLVIDPFSGSGTTLHAADVLGRRWIGIDQSLLAIKTTLKRLTLGRNPMGDFVKSKQTSDLFEENTLQTTRHECMNTNFNLIVDQDIAKTYSLELKELSEMLPK